MIRTLIRSMPRRRRRPLPPPLPSPRRPPIIWRSREMGTRSPNTPQLLATRPWRPKIRALQKLDRCREVTGMWITPARTHLGEIRRMAPTALPRQNPKPSIDRGLVHSFTRSDFFFIHALLYQHLPSSSLVTLASLVVMLSFNSKKKFRFTRMQLG